MFKPGLFVLTLALAALACGTSAPQTQPGLASPSLPAPALQATPAPPLAETTSVSPQSLPAADSPVPAAGLQVAYLNGGNVWMWNEAGARQLTFDGRAVAAALSKDGSLLAFLRGAEVWTVRVDGSSEQLLAALPGDGGSPYFAPNGSLLAVAAPDHIAVLDLNTGSNTTVLAYPAIPGFIPQVAWAMDSYGFKTVIPTSAEGGAAQLHYVFPDGNVANLGSLDLAPLGESWPLISPDGGYVIYAARNGEDGRSLMLMDASGATRPYGEPAARIRVGGWYPDSKHFVYISEGTGGGALFTGSVDGTPQVGAPFDPSLGRWVDAGHYLLLENGTLSLGDLGGGKWLIAGGVQEYAFSSP
ncbi:MAG: hypothetical protein ACOYYU_10625 [Chloroflexota bacterium]